MQPTYYERLLEDPELGLASVLDRDIPRLQASGPLLPNGPHQALNDLRADYVRKTIARYTQALAAQMSAEEFERFQQTPSYHEQLVQRATQQYWVYETFVYLRAYGERTLYVGPDTCNELLATPLEDYTREFILDTPAQMLVFDSPDLVDAFYAGERRSGPGRHHREASICVLALEARPDSGSRALRVLSAHGDGEKDYRVEVRQFFLEETLALEDILDAEDGSSWHGTEHVEELIGLPVRHLPWACRKADHGFYAAKTAYYRAVLGALHRAHRTPELLAWRPASAPVNGTVSRLGYSEILCTHH